MDKDTINQASSRVRKAASKGLAYLYHLDGQFVVRTQEMPQLDLVGVYDKSASGESIRDDINFVLARAY